MKLRDMLEMLSRHDGDLRVTIGGEEWEGGEKRLDANGRVSLDLTPYAAPPCEWKEEMQELERENSRLVSELAAMKERAEYAENDAAGLEGDVKRLREENSKLGTLLLKSKESLESVVRGLGDVVVEPIRK